jgi:hypothetical protein
MDNYAHLGGLFFGLLLAILLTAAPNAFGAWGLVLRAGFAVLLGGVVFAAAVPRADNPTSQAAQHVNTAVEAMKAKDYAAAIRAYDEAEAAGLKSWELYHDRALARQQRALTQPEGGPAEELKQPWQTPTGRVPRRERPEPYFLRGPLRWMMDDPQSGGGLKRARNWHHATRRGEPASSKSCRRLRAATVNRVPWLGVGKPEKWQGRRRVDAS